MPVELTLTRKPSDALATLGHLDVDGKPFCYTLEDPVRDLGSYGEGKIYGKTAIPPGRYGIGITYSPKFKKRMVLVKDVPYFTGIRIHSGNDAEDTLGCILVGSYLNGPDRIGGGSEVMPRLFKLIDRALDHEEPVWLEIKQGEANG